MKFIELTQGRRAIVDDEDFEFLDQFKWCVNNQNFVVRGKVIFGKKVTITMHRFLLNPVSKMQVDHINGDRLDNRRTNLRICTQSQNCSNRKSSTPNRSGYRGVVLHKSTGKWRACIKVLQRKISLGLYQDKESAARAYDAAAIKYFGNFSRLNFQSK